MRSRGSRLCGAAALAMLCSGCFGENLIVALSSDGDGLPDQETGNEGAGSESVGNSGDDGVLFDLGSGSIDPDLLDPQVPRSCATAWKYPSSMGCSFYAVDLDQAGLNDHDPWGVALVNVQTDTDANVRIQARVEGGWIDIVEWQAIAPGASELFPLPDLHHAGSGVFERAALRIDADVPVAALQVSPVAGGLSWRSGASLLHPLESWTPETHVMGWRSELEIGQPAYISIVAAVDGTTVEIVPGMETVGGVNLPPGKKDVPMMVPVNAAGIVQLAAQVAEIEFKAGLTGTIVTSGGEHPVAVFSAHACAGLPQVTGGECGHMQEQINMHLQGTEFAVPRLPVRNLEAPEPAMYQVYALEDDTTIEFEPGPGTIGVPLEGVTLNRGESYAARVTGITATAGDFVLHAHKPVLMAAYMENPPPNAIGSASMVQLAPMSRALAEYSVYLPPAWDEQVLVIARPVGVPVEIDGQTVDDAQFEPLGDYEAAHVAVDAGLHQIVGEEPFSLIVSGVRERDGYAYMGGWATPTPAFPPPK